MMTRTLTYIIAMLLLPTQLLAAEEKDSLAAFIGNNPNAVDIPVIYEGTTLNLSADEDNLLVNLSVAHPALQMRFLMQKASLYIDPSGKKRKKYEVVLPSALDVKDQVESGTRPDAETGQDTRPDIRPLLAALNKQGSMLVAGGTTRPLGYQRFHVEMDQKNDLLNYYVLLPKEILMHDKKLADKWAIGIFSVNDFANMPPPEQEGGEGMMPPPMGGENQQDMQELMQQDIREWVKFSIDEVNNANLKEQPDSIEVRALQKGDSIDIQLTVRPIETQLAFLMQGLNITLEQADTVRLSFPTAMMVRSKVKRHPNEVKAQMAAEGRQNVARTSVDSQHQVVRPDVLPLVAALNDTTATITPPVGSAVLTRAFGIDVDRENAVMTFSFKVHRSLLDTFANRLSLCIHSAPQAGGDRREFAGRKLSGEHAPQPDGLGEGIRKDDAERRTFLEKVSVNIVNANDY